MLYSLSLVRENTLSYLSDSEVWLQFILETGDFVPFVYQLLHSDLYIEMCYQPNAIMASMEHREYLLCVLSLLQNVKFDLGFLPKPPKLKSNKSLTFKTF